MSRTISTTYSSAITLTNTIDNPATITAGGTITDGSGFRALYAPGGPATDWTITNAGVITEQVNGYGVQLGSSGVHVTSAVITNQGAITGGGGIRIFNTGASSVVNQAGATITGTGTHGVELYGIGTVTNAGVISAAPGAGASDGVDLSAGGVIVNNAGATIAGGSGVVLAGSGTLTNGGTISGLASDGLAVQFGAAGGGRLIVDPGAVFNGIVVVGGGSVELASGASAGTLTGFDGSNFAEINSLQFDYGALWTISGDSSDAGLGTVSITGFTTGDTIELTGFGATSETFASDVLVLTNASDAHATLHIHGSFATGDFQIGHNAGASIIFEGPAAPVGTLSGTYDTGITLASQAVSVTGTISVASGVALYGTGGTYSTWTIDNSGTISSNTTYAVALGSGTSHIAYGILNNESLGVIAGGSAGVYMYGPGSVINRDGGTITGTVNNGIHFDGGLGTIVNYGVVLGGNYGVNEYQGGSVINQAGGTIAGSVDDGVRISGDLGTIVNAGILYGKVDGVYDGAGGSLTNLAGGTISGGVGVSFHSAGSFTNAGVVLGAGDAVSLYGGSTLTNAGTISAGSPGDYAVTFASGAVGTSRLIVDPGAVFNGRIAGDGGTIELASAASAGTLDGFGTSIINFASLVFDPGARWTVSGDTAASGFGTISIGGFTASDTIDLTGFAAISESATSDGLVLTDSHDNHATLHIQGGFTTADFHYIDNVGGGTDVTITATCYAAGTRILTPRGEVAIERLREGDLVVTVSGGTQPIRWIGHRHVEFRQHPNRWRVLPIRVARHAFGQGRPRRDLILSPDHAVFVEDVLIPIMHLVNGRSIAQIEVDAITYHHFELPRHDVVLADGLPAESYLEAGARDAFANVAAVMQLHPDFAPPPDRHAMLWEASGYAPLVLAGETLSRIRRNLTRQSASLDPVADAPTPRRRRPAKIVA